MKLHKQIHGLAIILFLSFCIVLSPRCETVHVWEKVDIPLYAKQNYDNPYTDVAVWVDLKGPNFNKRCYGFWDGDNQFRVRILAVSSGTWSWQSGSNQSDDGLNGQKGSFTAIEWTEKEKRENPCRRGMIQASADGHTFEYADGTSFFYTADTWWSAFTHRFPWRESDTKHEIGPQAGFKDYVRYRKQQGYNGIAVIAAFPHWINDDKPPRLITDNGTALRDGWPQHGTGSVKDMRDEDGNYPFHFPGKVPGYEKYFPDVYRINPKYFQSLDKKIDYLNEQGFIPFLEVARRDIGQAWKKYYEWPDSYTRYIQYIWSRYQANNCLFSPIHFDWNANTIPLEDWNEAANLVIEKYGHPPFGTLAGCNSAGSSLHMFDHRKDAKWITFHQIGNKRTHNNYALLTEIFFAQPPLPCLNGEPYYDGWGEDPPAGSETAALYCRSGMYGSVLSGGLAGHIYGAGGTTNKGGGSLWGGNIEEESKHHIWDAIQWPSGQQMEYLRTFVLSEGNRYRNLIPTNKLLTPHQSGKTNGYEGWAYCARTPEKDFFLLYFERNCPRATLSGVKPDGKYQGKWFNPRTGDWIKIDQNHLIADSNGEIKLPDYPDHTDPSSTDWGLSLILSE